MMESMRLGRASVLISLINYYTIRVFSFTSNCTAGSVSPLFFHSSKHILCQADLLGVLINSIPIKISLLLI